jgi:hypothetical protein
VLANLLAYERRFVEADAVRAECCFIPPALFPHVKTKKW